MMVILETGVGFDTRGLMELLVVIKALGLVS